MYTINEVAEICNISPYTLRFYDKEGLLPFVSRNRSGNRQFSDTDLNVIKLICCLKNTGMQIKDIKKYVDLVMQGAETSAQRKQIMIEHRKMVLNQIEDLKKNLNIIELKIALYDKEDASSFASIFSEQEE
ncbi:MerR family transcriptional regulator [Anaerocolumna sp. AGMB13025]|jgi:DNA-binding transcriptional MerR regulator|uniref:MerR family transcriptional regulator n=1 Tax=Anaerocolumna sp. AGMB13025 TaxID=3039116 RepID=UPI00241DF15B|nr:MerR family transcriptional regulator [Anaerocolumna sp. AGMB13025]WFR58948.1 MerR family transcriptional regulator [Anaerocolumna sp. AGMB13025]